MKSSILLNFWAGIIYIFLLLPTLVVIPISLGGDAEIAFPPSAISLDLYRDFFSRADWIGALLQSLQVAVASSLLALVVGGMAAYALGRGGRAHREWLSAFFVSPLMVPTVVFGLGAYFLFSQLGLTGTTLGLILAHTVYGMPFVLICVADGLRSIPSNIEMAARICGASDGEVIWRVTMPLLKRSLVAGGLFVFLTSFDEVVIATFLTSPGTTTLPVKMYSSIQWEISPILAAASTVLTVVSIIVCVALTLSGAARPADTSVVT